MQDAEAEMPGAWAEQQGGREAEGGSAGHRVRGVRSRLLRAL